MATPSNDHYMRAYSDDALRRVLADPAQYSVGERLDADAILDERFMASAPPHVVEHFERCAAS